MVLGPMYASCIPCVSPGRPRRPSLNCGLISSSTTASTDLRSLSFQSLTTIKSRNHFLLITIQNAWGWVGGARYAGVKLILELHESLVTDHESLTLLECAVTRFRAVTPLECALTKTAPCKSFRMRSSEKRWGEGGRPFIPIRSYSLPSPKGKSPRGRDFEHPGVRPAGGFPDREVPFLEAVLRGSNGSASGTARDPKQSSKLGGCENGPFSRFGYARRRCWGRCL